MPLSVSEIKESLSGLEKASSAESILPILNRLKLELEPTESLLRETRAGIVVNRLRSHSDRRVSDLVKLIIKSWKDEVTLQKNGMTRAKQLKGSSDDDRNKNNLSHGGHKNKNSNKNNEYDNENKGSEGDTEKKEEKFRDRNAVKDGVRTNIYEDRTRCSFLEAIYNSLVLDSVAPATKIFQITKSIEMIVYKAEGSVNTTYKSKMRSLYMSLKGKTNPKLRSSVVDGSITPERLCSMTPQEMASDELKKEIHALEQQNLFKAQGAKEQRSTTDRFTCGKCKQKKVSYYQMQTRSADEPLTTFCTCENCGNRWKFS